MPSLSDYYRKYSELTKKLNEIYNRLDEKQAPIKAFLEQKKVIFDQHIQLRLGLVPMEERFDKTKEKKTGLEVKLRQLTPQSAEGLKVTVELENINRMIIQQQAAIDATKAQVTDLEKENPWIKPGTPFSEKDRKGVNKVALHEYTIVFEEAVKMRRLVQGAQGDIAIALPKAKQAEITKAQSDYQTENMKNQSNNKGLTRQVLDKGLLLIGDFHYKLNSSYQNKAAAQVRYDGAKAVHDKLRGEYLQSLPLEKWAKQTYYCSILPEYLVNEFPIDTYLKGHRAWGVGKINTEEKLHNIRDFLAKPFTQNKNEDIAFLKELLTNVGVQINDKALGRVYNRASKAQPPIAAEPEKPQLRM